MAMARSERIGLDRPERWRRWLDLDFEPEWLRVEEIQENGTLVVKAEIPGIDPDKDVEVSVTDGVLHISAKREEHTELTEKAGYRSEFRYGEFTRDIDLPSGIDREAIIASYKDGILEVRMPWPSERPAASTKVPVSRS